MTSAEYPEASVVIPCRNEAAHVLRAIDSVLASEYPREKLELIVVDGMSTDGTRELLRDAASRHPGLRVLDNPAMTAPAAMNIGIRASRHAVIVRLDAHSEYPPDYIPRCVGLLRSSPGLGNAGGRLVPVPNGSTPWAKAVSYVTSHRFGVGTSAFRTAERPGLVDTVPFGTFPREALEKVGLYDVRLTRNQDNELNARLQRAGYGIAFDPGIRLRYRNQADLRGLTRQAWFTGMWNVYTLALYPYTFRLRRFVPAAFVAYLALLAGAAFLRAPAAAAAPLALYAALVSVVSLRGGGEAGGPLPAAATFASYHVAYGAGTLLGVVKVLTGRWREELGRPLGGRGA